MVSAVVCLKGRAAAVFVFQEDFVNVVMYGTTTCQPCRLVERRLTQLEVPFHKVLLDQDDAALADVKARAGRDMISTPALEVDGEFRMFGLEPSALQSVIDESRAGDAE